MEKYSTEVVLQQYRGELTLLGSRTGSAPPEPDNVEVTNNEPPKSPPVYDDDIVPF